MHIFPRALDLIREQEKKEKKKEKKKKKKTKQKKKTSCTPKKFPSFHEETSSSAMCDR
jgi:hypothetical protein